MDTSTCLAKQCKVAERTYSAIPSYGSRAFPLLSAMALPMKKIVMKAMKSAAMKVKAPKGMKAMKKKAITNVARGKLAKMVVFKGRKEKTATGLQKAQLMKNKRGKVVTKKQHARGKALFQKFAQRWLDAVMTARKELGVKGFCAVGGKSAQGKALYAKAKALYAA